MSSIDPRPSPSLPLTIVTKRHADPRGSFSKSFHLQRVFDLGITCNFVQDNQSRSRHKGALRGVSYSRTAGGEGQADQCIA
jgi:dTDP-4-dehydrorhamnose 3,5-epimerase